MIVLISGSREGFTYKDFKEKLLSVTDPDKITEMVSGGARGVDTFARRFSSEFGLKFKCLEADWDNLGKKAGMVRNVEMAEYVKAKTVGKEESIVVAFRNNHSSGTTHMIKSAQRLGLDLVIFDKQSVDFDFE